MEYVVFDLEWNQPAWGVPAVTEPVHLTGEIIEIGAVKLNDDFQAIEEFRIFVTPQYYTSMNQKVLRLTKIHGNYLKAHGVPFPEAYRRFIQWCGDNFAFMTWSQNDLPMLVDNLHLHGMDVSQLPVCIDVQRIFGWEIMGTSRCYSLENAMDFWGERGDRAHDALHDARNTVRICNHLDLDGCIDEYASRVFAEPPRSKSYERLSEMLQDEDLCTFRCPWCGEKIRCEGWVQTSGSRCMAVGTCSEGDEFVVFLSRTRTADGRLRASRLIYEMSDDLWDLYQRRLEKVSAAG